MKSTLRTILATFAFALFALAIGQPADAGTTGVISGTVRDAETRAPLPNVLVDAVSSTGRYSTHTGKRGFYSFTGVSPDTYTVTFTLTGFEPVVIHGMTVVPDQATRVRAALSHAVKTLGEVVAHSAGAAFQPAQTVDTYSVTKKEIETIQGNALNTSEANLINSLPGATADDAGFPSIRGGRENEHGFQFEGIPYVDAFTSQTTNSLATPGLGLRSAQLTPGAGNASFGNGGTGTINLIANRGTYPSSSTMQIAVGGPNFYHGLNVDYGTAAPDGRWAAYVSFAGANTTPLYGGKNAAPAALLMTFGNQSLSTDREILGNFSYRFGPNMDRSIQLFYNDAQHNFTNANGGNPYCFKTCDPVFAADTANLSMLPSLPNQLSTGLTPTQIAQMIQLDPYQTSPFQKLASVGRPPEVSYQPNHAVKLQFDDNIDASTFFSTKVYRVNSVTTLDSPVLNGSIMMQGGLTSGAAADLTKQMGAKHLLQLGVDYAFLHPVFDQPSNLSGIQSTFLGSGDPVTGLGAGEAFDFISPSDPNCPIAEIGGTCGYLAAFFPKGIPKIPNNLQQSISNRTDFSLYANDSFAPTDRLKFDIGLRFDAANYRLPDPVVDQATCTTLYIPSSWTPSKTPGVCPTATFNVNKAATRPRILQPRFSFAYQVGENSMLRFSYGRSVLFPPLGQIDLYVPPQAYAAFFNVPSFDNIGSALSGTTMPAQCGIPNFQVTCKNYGDQLRWENQNAVEGVPIQPVKPEIFNNFDISLEHQFPRGISFKLTPYYRRGYDATALAQSPVIGPDGKPIRNPDGTFVLSPVVATNLGYERTMGAEALFTKESQFGLSGQFSMNYINEFTSVIPLSNNENNFPTIPPASLALGNLYKVGYVSPFSTTLDLSYQTRNGWRISPQIQYNVGYPNGTGYFSSVFINGIAYNVPNTNGSAATNEAPNGTVQYVDPMNPGSLFAPHIAATRGTPDSAVAGGLRGHPASVVDATLEYSGMKNQVLGFTVNNVFNELHSGAQVNLYYQPLATGYAGALTGVNPLTQQFPGLGYANETQLIRGHEAYVNPPNASGRLYYFYYQIKI